MMEKEKMKHRELELIDVLIVYLLVLTYILFGGFLFDFFAPVWASLFFSCGFFFIPAVYVIAFRMDFKLSFGFKGFLKNIKNPRAKIFVILGAFFLALGILLVEIVGSVLISPFVGETGAVSDVIQNQILSDQYVLSILMVAVFPAVFEELLCRGFLLQVFQKRFSGIKAILLCSFLFALLHFNPVRIPFAFVAGLSLSWIAWKTDSVVLPIFMHFFHNFGLFLIVKFSFSGSENVTLPVQPSDLDLSAVFDLPTLFMCACVGVLGVFFVIKGIRLVLSGYPLKSNAHSITEL